MPHRHKFAGSFSTCTIFPSMHRAELSLYGFGRRSRTCVFPFPQSNERPTSWTVSWFCSASCFYLLRLRVDPFLRLGEKNGRENTAEREGKN